jgi:hypothetical protein
MVTECQKRTGQFHFKRPRENYQVKTHLQLTTVVISRKTIIRIAVEMGILIAFSDGLFLRKGTENGVYVIVSGAGKHETEKFIQFSLNPQTIRAIKLRCIKYE